MFQILRTLGVVVFLGMWAGFITESFAVLEQNQVSTFPTDSFSFAIHKNEKNKINLPSRRDEALRILLALHNKQNPQKIFKEYELHQVPMLMREIIHLLDKDENFKAEVIKQFNQRLARFSIRQPSLPSILRYLKALAQKQAEAYSKAAEEFECPDCGAVNQNPKDNQEVTMLVICKQCGNAFEPPHTNGRKSLQKNPTDQIDCPSQTGPINTSWLTEIGDRLKSFFKLGGPEVEKKASRSKPPEFTIKLPHPNFEENEKLKESTPRFGRESSSNLKESTPRFGPRKINHPMPEDMEVANEGTVGEVQTLVYHHSPYFNEEEKVESEVQNRFQLPAPKIQVSLVKVLQPLKQQGLVQSVPASVALEQEMALSQEGPEEEKAISSDDEVRLPEAKEVRLPDVKNNNLRNNQWITYKDRLNLEEILKGSIDRPDFVLMGRLYSFIKENVEKDKKSIYIKNPLALRTTATDENITEKCTPKEEVMHTLDRAVEELKEIQDAFQKKQDGFAALIALRKHQAFLIDAVDRYVTGQRVFFPKSSFNVGTRWFHLE